MRPSFFRRYGKPGLLVAPLALAGALLGAPSSASAPAPPLAPIPTIAPHHLNAAAAPLDLARPAATAARLLQPGIPAVTLSARATPTAATAPKPLRVGIQVGHWRAAELPDEQLQLRDSTGVFAGGHAEAEVGLDIARRVAALLASDGIVVDVLPATIPPGYAADAFVALHADGAESGDARGFKLTTPLAASRASLHLLETLADEYGHATGLPRGGASTANMRGYYAFNYHR
ncbi:MAG TPA: N-acetylmuramoyl-L-alanine amidase, partial [Roseiflexaceae bacterium]